MATAKYKRGKDGYFQAKVWDGSYLENGKKHYVPLRSKKSSKDLEQKVQEYNENVRNRKNIRNFPAKSMCLLILVKTVKS